MAPQEGAAPVPLGNGEGMQRFASLGSAVLPEQKRASGWDVASGETIWVLG